MRHNAEYTTQVSDVKSLVTVRNAARNGTVRQAVFSRGLPPGLPHREEFGEGRSFVPNRKWAARPVNDGTSGRLGKAEYTHRVWQVSIVV